jgi:hypothetical protein
MFAEILAKQLMQRGKSDISDHDLHKLIFSIAEKTDFDDGTLCPPPPTPPPAPVVIAAPPQQDHLYDNYSASKRFALYLYTKFNKYLSNSCINKINIILLFYLYVKQGKIRI